MLVIGEGISNSSLFYLFELRAVRVERDVAFPPYKSYSTIHHCSSYFLVTFISQCAMRKVAKPVGLTGWGGSYVMPGEATRTSAPFTKSWLGS